MHDFFDKLGAAAKRAAGNVATEVNVAAEKQKVSDAYRELGKRYYLAVKRGETPDLSEEIARIDSALARIENLKDRRNVTPEPAPAASPVACPEEASVEEPTEDPAAPEVPAFDAPDFFVVDI